MKRDTTKDIMTLLKNAEDLSRWVFDDESLPPGQQRDNNMIVAIPPPEEDETPYDDSLPDTGVNRGQPQQPLLLSSSPTSREVLVSRHKEKRAYENRLNINQPVDKVQGSLVSKFIIVAMLVITAILFFAMKIQIENQFILRREIQEFHESTR